MTERGAPTLPQQVELDHLLPTSHMDIDNSLERPARGSLLAVMVCAVAGLEIGECSGTDTCRSNSPTDIVRLVMFILHFAHNVPVPFAIQIMGQHLSLVYHLVILLYPKFLPHISMDRQLRFLIISDVLFPVIAPILTHGEAKTCIHVYRMKRIH